MRIKPSNATQFVILYGVFLLLASCSGTQEQELPAHPPVSQTFVVSQMAEDPSYGYSHDNPVIVGDGNPRNGVRYEHMYLMALAGPNGEEISYERLGSCCAFPTPNGYRGGGLLDLYQITYPGIAQPVILYLNMYDPGPLFIPHGLTSVYSHLEATEEKQEQTTNE